MSICASESGAADKASADEDFVNSLNARISQMGSVRDSMQAEDPEPSPLESFEGASDEELARRFNNRLEEVSPAAPDDSVPLTGRLTLLPYEVPILTGFSIHLSCSYQAL